MALNFAWPRPRDLRFWAIGSVIVLALLVLMQGTSSRYQSSNETSLATTTAKKARLHLLIPATSTGLDLCKLILSSSILNYPTPVLINYGAHEDANAYVQHLAKVDGILNYLKSVPESTESEDDLFLIIDGYDVWFQLRPDVLIKRYYELNRIADARSIATYGKELFQQYDMRQTIVFNNDKICWPIDWSRPACWAVPISDLDPQAFGPETGVTLEERNQPRWLNSGTIMGPLHDLKDMFEATLEAIHTKHVTDSDQWYFANVFGKQEYARLSKKPDLLEKIKAIKYDNEIGQEKAPHREAPDLTGRTEYHIGIDYASAQFQTLAFSKQYLSWLKPSNLKGWALGYKESLGSERYPQGLSPDLASSPKPYKDLRPDSNETWADHELLYNTYSGLVPVGVHFTGSRGEKEFRQSWWQKTWFQKEAEALRFTSVKEGKSLLYDQPIEGLMWHKYEAEPVGNGGAWGDSGSWYPWNVLCKAHEPRLYFKKGDPPLEKEWTPPEGDKDKGVAAEDD